MYLAYLNQTFHVSSSRLNSIYYIRKSVSRSQFIILSDIYLYPDYLMYLYRKNYMPWYGNFAQFRYYIKIYHWYVQLLYSLYVSLLFFLKAHSGTYRIYDLLNLFINESNGLQTRKVNDLSQNTTEVLSMDQSNTLEGKEWCYSIRSRLNSKYSIKIRVQTNPKTQKIQTWVHVGLTKNSYLWWKCIFFSIFVWISWLILQLYSLKTLHFYVYWVS